MRESPSIVAIRRLLHQIVLLPVLAQVGCGGGSSPPQIDSFSASTAVARSGMAFELLAEFDRGEATIDQGVGVGDVRSGVPVQVSQTEAGHYTLTVTVTDSQGRTSTASIDVPMAPRMVWTFDTDQPGCWPQEKIHDGILDVSAYQPFDPEGICADNDGHLTLSAPELVDGRYPHADFVFDTPRREGDITITYAGRTARFVGGSWTPERVLVRFDQAAGTAITHVDGVLYGTQVTTRVADQGSGIDIHVHACSPDLGDSQEFFLDTLTIEAC